MLFYIYYRLSLFFRKAFELCGSRADRAVYMCYDIIRAAYHPSVSITDRIPPRNGFNPVGKKGVSQFEGIFLAFFDRQIGRDNIIFNGISFGKLL